MLNAGKSDQPGNEKMPVYDNVEDSVFMKHRHATVVWAERAAYKVWR